MFLLFVNRQNIYIFSKKCLSEEEQNKLREIFTEKINTLIDIKESERKSEWKKTLKNSAQPLKS